MQIGTDAVTGLPVGSRNHISTHHEFDTMANEHTGPTNNATSSIEQVSSEDEFDQLLGNEDRILVDFYADWCGPCKMMAPTVEELADESDVSVVKIDVETLPQIATRYDVSSIPTFITFADGEIQERLVGMHAKDVLAETLK